MKMKSLNNETSLIKALSNFNGRKLGEHILFRKSTNPTQISRRSENTILINEHITDLLNCRYCPNLLHKPLGCRVITG